MDQRGAQPIRSIMDEEDSCPAGAGFLVLAVAVATAVETVARARAVLVPGTGTAVLPPPTPRGPIEAPHAHAAGSADTATTSSSVPCFHLCCSVFRHYPCSDGVEALYIFPCEITSNEHLGANGTHASGRRYGSARRAVSNAW